ncbi:hypothetical protein H7U32_00350 [Bifidobacterium pullorum subsp. saeculare]|uniref:MFS transporter n=1 Tax=Bifidobacterium pullorum subsp. saeculare TaxID=78257 RepID=A0A938WVJ9_9BIFI|nr:hypothetical protein [Bifidobacterium pullorum]MBM6698806.1 hypothetical protein [Bifidobacterium pullorum subsp. saeculare]
MTIQKNIHTPTFGLLTAFSTFGTPLGMAVFGPLCDVIAVQAVFVIGGLLTLPVAVWVLHGALARQTVIQ